MAHKLCKDMLIQSLVRPYKHVEHVPKFKPCGRISGFANFEEKKRKSDQLMLCTCHRLPQRGGPRADVVEYGDIIGTLQQISALVVGDMWGLRFLHALLSGGEEIGNDRYGKMEEEEKNVCFQINWFVSIKQTIRPKICTYL